MDVVPSRSPGLGLGRARRWTDVHGKLGRPSRSARCPSPLLRAGRWCRTAGVRRPARTPVSRPQPQSLGGPASSATLATPPQRVSREPRAEVGFSWGRGGGMRPSVPEYVLPGPWRCAWSAPGRRSGAGDQAVASYPVPCEPFGSPLRLCFR